MASRSMKEHRKAPPMPVKGMHRMEKRMVSRPTPNAGLARDPRDQSGSRMGARRTVGEASPEVRRQMLQEAMAPQRPKPYQPKPMGSAPKSTPYADSSGKLKTRRRYINDVVDDATR